MLRLGRKRILLLFFFLCTIRQMRGLTQDDPLLFDRLLHIVWEPSGLVRLWIAFDQFYNVASSWRGVARSLITLPFKEAREARSHITIKGHNSAGSRLGDGDSISAHRDRFAKAYSSSNPPAIPTTGHNFIVEAQNSLAASNSVSFPNVALPAKYPSDIFHRNYIRGPSVFGNSQKSLLDHIQDSRLLVKHLLELPAVSTQLPFQKPPFTDLVKDTGIFSDHFQQHSWLNRYLPSAHPGYPLKAPGIHKLFGTLHDPFSKNNAMRNPIALEHNLRLFHFLEENGAFQQASDFTIGTGISIPNSIDRRHKSSKLRKYEGSLESIWDHLHPNEQHGNAKVPLGAMAGADPQVRLQMALRLIKELGRIHLSRVQPMRAE